MISLFDRKTTFGFLVVGLLAAISNLITFRLFIEIGSSIYISTLFGNIVSALVHFRGLAEVFGSSNKINSFTKYITSWVIYYFLTIWFVTFLIFLKFSPFESRAITLTLLTPISYLIQKLFIFR